MYIVAFFLRWKIISFSSLKTLIYLWILIYWLTLNRFNNGKRNWIILILNFNAFWYETMEIIVEKMIAFVWFSLPQSFYVDNRSCKEVYVYITLEIFAILIILLMIDHAPNVWLRTNCKRVQSLILDDQNSLFI